MLASNYSSAEVAFTLVYIREAHANDEWPSPSSRDQPQGKVIDIPSHNNIEERIEVASRMKEEMEIDSNIEVLVDNMEDEFNKEFAAWPIRYFIAKDGKLLHKSDNSIENDVFDQDSIQNFFRGLGFVRVHVPKLVQPSEEKPFAWFNPKPPPPPPMTKMAHASSGRLLMACCCSPCICIIAPGFICVSKLRKRIKNNSNRLSEPISGIRTRTRMAHFSSGPLRPIKHGSRGQEIDLESRFRVKMAHSSSGPLRVKDLDMFEEEDSDSGSWLDSEFGGRDHESSGTILGPVTRL